MALFNDSWIYPISQVERSSEELYKTEDFYRKEGGARRYLQKKRKDCLGKVTFP